MRLGFVAGGIAGRYRRFAAPRGGLQLAEIGAVPAAGGEPRYAERGRRCTCTSVWRGGSCRHLRVPSRCVGFRMASNLFVKPSAEPDLFGLCRGEKRSTNVNVFVKPGAEPDLFRLCRGGKTKNEIQRFTPAANRRDRGGFRSGVGIPPTGRAVRPQNLCMARTRNEMFFDVCSTKGGSIPIWVVMAVHASSPSVEEK